MDSWRWGCDNIVTYVTGISTAEPTSTGKEKRTAMTSLETEEDGPAKNGGERGGEKRSRQCRNIRNE